ncbi:hypothetical protein GCM10027259_52030 [Micromonospora palomenae]
MEGIVQLTITGSREPVPLDVTGRHFYRCNAAERSRRRARTEPVYGTGSREDLRGENIADAVQLCQGGAAGRDRGTERGRGIGDAPVQPA